ncbi:hypothetical protein SAMN05421827_109112 [Pedobacter terrae]|uniref:Uncharacterized protein n=1 Tax=Pedobacter terrae TaxID=405671 RepID=A0A1G7W5V6_9SPHI|nr:hypothetical protein [Pedobacter terrae]SDG67328.1 hypothetical protein SAMN05421827_109112 [Pedobacter terrae]
MKLTDFFKKVETPAGNILVYKLNDLSKPENPFICKIIAVTEESETIDTTVSFSVEGNRDELFANPERQIQSILKMVPYLESKAKKQETARTK